MMRNIHTTCLPAVHQEPHPHLLGDQRLHFVSRDWGLTRSCYGGCLVTFDYCK